jgi:hypothetical protein
MAKKVMLKDLVQQFLVPLVLTASGLGLLVFWPFAQ